MLELVNEKVTLKEFSEENLYDKKYFSWLRDLEVVTPLYRTEYLKPIDFKSVENYVQNLLKSPNDCFFAVYATQTNEFIGTHRIGHINWRAGIGDLGIMIGDKTHWRKGVADSVLKLSIPYCFKTLSLRRLTGGTPKTNIAMCKCFEKNGFTLEGTKRQELLINGQYVDHVFYGLLKEEVENEK
jgi:[ribosomal protein S5]-alanine N-acetyltransferase